MVPQLGGREVGGGGGPQGTSIFNNYSSSPNGLLTQRPRG